MTRKKAYQLIKLFGDLYTNHTVPFIEKNFPRNNFTEPVFYYLDKETIRFRSGLSILINQMLSGDLKNVIPISVSSEIIYPITLLQDDIFDNDETRWGRPSGWMKYGTGNVMICADYSYFYVIDILKKIPKALNNRERILKSFFESHRKLYSSFLIEKNNKNNLSFGLKDVLKVYKFKTNTGINATHCGALSVDFQPKELYNGIKKYAIYLGWAAQIRDDIKDLESFKKESSDIKNGYMTYPIVKLMKMLPSNEREDFNKNFGVDDNRSVNKILSLLKKYQVKLSCIADVYSMVDKALTEVNLIKKFDRQGILETWAETHKIFD